MRIFLYEIWCFTVIFLFVSVSLLNVTNTDDNNKNSVTLKVKYDVFISFRGDDTRKGFFSHLHKALLSTNIISAFVDSDILKGEEIAQLLYQAIERSSISVVLFSPDYASSKWCLNELVKIVECKKKNGQILLPVFYEVEPQTVRHQRGTYADAFAQHEKNYTSTVVQQWRSALNESANLSGYPSSNYA
jgi:hypothetical protein